MKKTWWALRKKGTKGIYLSRFSFDGGPGTPALFQSKYHIENLIRSADSTSGGHSWNDTKPEDYEPVRVRLEEAE